VYFVQLRRVHLFEPTFTEFAHRNENLDHVKSAMIFHLGRYQLYFAVADFCTSLREVIKQEKKEREKEDWREPSRGH